MFEILILNGPKKRGAYTIAIGYTDLLIYSLKDYKCEIQLS